VNGDGVTARRHDNNLARNTDSAEARKCTYATTDLVEEARKLYRERGISYTLWWYLSEVWRRRRHWVKFEDLFRLHQSIAGVRSKNATRKALKRLEEYGLIENLGDGYYRPLILDRSIAEGSIDFSRVRTRDQVLRREATAEFRRQEELPRELRPVLDTARRLIERGEKWKAVDLLAHTVLPIRKTGVLLARKGDAFIYYERKTDKMHMLKSGRLAQVFDELGIKDTILVEHRFHEADDIVRKLFGSHDNARRLHYLLKERGWFEYLDNRYYYRIYEDPVTGGWELTLYQLNRESGQLEEERVEVSGEVRLGVQRKAGAVVTKEHIKAENEETYFHRTKGWA